MWVAGLIGRPSRTLDSRTGALVPHVLHPHLMLRPTKSALIVGSAPEAAQLSNTQAPAQVLIAVNNAWRIRPDFAYSVYPYDFPPERRAPSSIRHVTNLDYMRGMDSAGGITLCGATMALAAGYWATHDLRPMVLGFAACNMVYGSSQNHFYGNGTADPLREDVTLRCLEAKVCRLFLFALSRGTLCVNTMPIEGSRLVLPALSLEALPVSRFGLWQLHRKVMRSALCKELLSFYTEQRTAEQHAPFPLMTHEYWIGKNDEDIAFIDAIDAKWLQARQSICDLLRHAG